MSRKRGGKKKEEEEVIMYISKAGVRLIKKGRE